MKCISFEVRYFDSFIKFQYAAVAIAIEIFVTEVATLNYLK